MSELNATDNSSEAHLLPADVRVFVNERGVSIPRGANALDAVRAHNPTQADDVTAARARITDSRGLPMAPETVLLGGAILRVLAVREQPGEPVAEHDTEDDS